VVGDVTYPSIRKPAAPVPYYSITQTLDASVTADGMLAMLSVFFVACTLLVAAIRLNEMHASLSSRVNLHSFRPRFRYTGYPEFQDLSAVLHHPAKD
jgi:hypothetical protein